MKTSVETAPKKKKKTFFIETGASAGRQSPFRLFYLLPPPGFSLMAHFLFLLKSRRKRLHLWIFAGVAQRHDRFSSFVHLK